MAKEKDKWAKHQDEMEEETVATEATDESEAKQELTYPAHEELIAKINDLENKLLRTQAEMDNMRRRTEREVAQTYKFAIEGFAKELLAVVDNLERALDQKVESDPQAWRTGVELTLKLLQKTLEKSAIKVIDPVGEMFDPTLHEAMSTQVSEDKPAGTVLMVLQKGYQLHDRLLRPALVIVAKATEK